MFYDTQGNHVNTVETLLSRPSDSVYSLQSWNNGKFVAEGTFDENAPQTQFSWSVLNDCLASQGISWAMIGSISILCAAACVGTAGAACVACIGGLASANGTVIGHCVGMAISA